MKEGNDPQKKLAWEYSSDSWMRKTGTCLDNPAKYLCEKLKNLKFPLKTYL